MRGGQRERENEPKFQRQFSYTLKNSLHAALDQGLTASGTSSPLISIKILLQFDPKAWLSCMKQIDFHAFSLLRPCVIHPSWLDTLGIRVVSRTHFGCPRLSTSRESRVLSLDSSLYGFYWTTLITYNTCFSDWKSQKWPANGSCGPSLDLYHLSR